MTRCVRPRDRLLAAIASGSLASAYAGGIVASLGIPAVDVWLRHLWFALPLTWFMVAGACNAMNLIDGANGLAGGTALIMFGGLAAAAGLAGDTLSLTEALVMMGAILGFLAWNYPAGRVFLGDAGAYFVGFVYAELAIRIVARNDGISAWFVIMLAAYPIIETVFSIYRRKVLRRTATMAPDALHLHSLIFRRVARRLDRRLPDLGRGLANARVAPLLWAHGTLCMALAVAFRENTPALMVCVAGYATLYVASYRTLVRFRNRRIQWTIESQRRLATQS